MRLPALDRHGLASDNNSPDSCPQKVLRHHLLGQSQLLSGRRGEKRTRELSGGNVVAWMARRRGGR